jgi:hypothetical protein
MAKRGDGIGLEVTKTMIRGVRLAHDQPGRVASAAEVPIARFQDHAVVFDALVRVRGQLGTSPLPTRVAWFPARSTMQRIDATGLTGPELNSLRHALASSADITSTMLVDADARRWMLVLRWDHSEAWRVQELVERAGFVDVALEPSPVSIERVLAVSTRLARRDAGENRSWTALYDDSVPLAAATVEAHSRDSPGLSVTSDSIGLHNLDEILPEAELADEVGEITRSSLTEESNSSELDLNLQLVGEPYPPFPAHDLRAPQRVAVALGAATGAAGLAGRLRPVDVLAPTHQVGDGTTNPWAIERIIEPPLQIEHETPSRWQQQRRRLFRR